MLKTHAYPNIALWARLGFEMSTHQFTSLGMDAIIVERANDDVNGLQTGLAFARGACQQYHTCQQVGVDLSLWWGAINNCVQDLPALYHKRHLYLAYHSGAPLILIEGGNLLVSAEAPSLLAQELAAFGNYTLHNPPGTVQASGAIIIAHDAGFMSPAYWRYNRTVWGFGFIEPRPGVRGKRRAVNG